MEESEHWPLGLTAQGQEAESNGDLDSRFMDYEILSSGRVSYNMTAGRKFPFEPMGWTTAKLFRTYTLAFKPKDWNDDTRSTKRNLSRLKWRTAIKRD